VATCVLSVCFQAFQFGKLVDCHANIQYDWPWHRFSVSMDRKVSLMTFSLFLTPPSSLEAFWIFFLIFLLLDEMAKAVWFS
jgi:hypothetical protein